MKYLIDDIGLYEINDLDDYGLIREKLYPVFEETINSQPNLEIQTVDQLDELIQNRLAVYDPSFMLWVGIDKTIHQIVCVCICNAYLFNGDRYCNLGLVYFKSGYLLKYGRKLFLYAEDWARELQCNKMKFITSHDKRIYDRLMRPFGFLPGRVTYEREVRPL